MTAEARAGGALQTGKGTRRGSRAERVVDGKVLGGAVKNELIRFVRAKL